MQAWRPVVQFVTANLDQWEAVSDCIRKMNSGKQGKEQPFRAEGFRGNYGLNLADYKEMGVWMVQSTISGPNAIRRKCEELAYRRRIKYHVFGAPPEKVHPNKSMPKFVRALARTNITSLAHRDRRDCVTPGIYSYPGICIHWRQLWWAILVQIEEVGGCAPTMEPTLQVPVLVGCIYLWECACKAAES